MLFSEHHQKPNFIYAYWKLFQTNMNEQQLLHRRAFIFFCMKRMLKSKWTNERILCVVGATWITITSWNHHYSSFVCLFVFFLLCIEVGNCRESEKKNTNNNRFVKIWPNVTISPCAHCTQTFSCLYKGKAKQ